jgi:hypothetical protein
MVALSMLTPTVNTCPKTMPRFSIEAIEERIAPQGSLLDLNLNLTIQDVNITISHINVVVAGNVIQVGVLSGPMTGVVTSLTQVTA